MNARAEIPAFLRKRPAKHPVIDLAAEERKAAAERTAEAVEKPRVHLHVYGLGLFVSAGLALGLAIALGGAAAGILSDLGSDWLMGHCLMPSQIECDRGRPIFDQSDFPAPTWLIDPPGEHGA